MLTGEARRVPEQAKRLYEEKYRQTPEKDHAGALVCIEPELGEYFVGETVDEAVNKALDAHPDRLTYRLRVGHTATLHLGALVR